MSSVSLKSAIKRLFFLGLVAVSLIPGPRLHAETAPMPHQGSPYRALSTLQENEILHLPTGLTVSVEQMVDVLAGSRVIYVGETHDNLEAHRVQLEVIRRLNEKFPGKVAVGMEMFRRSAQPDLDRWQAGQLPQKEFRRLFRRNWGMGYGVYAPIFDYLDTHRLPLLGLKASRETEQLLRENGPGHPGLPEMDLDDRYHKAYAMALFGANTDHAPEAVKPYQMLTLWEESMAQSVSEFLKDPRYAEFKLVVLAGGFHVQFGHGIPKRAFRRVPHAYTIVLPTVTEIPDELKASREMKLNPVSIPLYSSDFAWKLEYRVRHKSGIRLGVMLEESDAGLKVKQVMEGSNAAGLGIQEGDTLLTLDGQPLDGLDDLRERLEAKRDGDTVQVTVLHHLENRSLSGTLHSPKHP